MKLSLVTVCSSTFTVSTQNSNTTGTVFGVAGPAAQASQARASKAARGPCLLFCASGRDREPAQVKDRSVDGSLCGLQNLQTLNFQILNIHSFKHTVF